METKLASPKKLAVAILTLFTLLVCLSLSAQAQRKMEPPQRPLGPRGQVGPNCAAVMGNLFANCGFETGDFTGWTVLNPADGNTFVDGNPNNGAFAASLGSVSLTNCIGQSLETNPGQVYTLSFALTNAFRPNNFYVLFNGATVSGDMQNMPDFPYTQYTIGSLTAVGADRVFFCARNDPSFFTLDDAIFN